jgi:hypothetical protein
LSDLGCREFVEVVDGELGGVGLLGGQGGSHSRCNSRSRLGAAAFDDRGPRGFCGL